MQKPPLDDYNFDVPSGFSFEERSGDPDSFSAAIGRIVLNFSELEVQLSAGITKCLELDEASGRIVTSGLSFSVKTHMLSSLVRNLSSTTRFNVGRDDAVASWDKLLAHCFRSEELRNQILHSEWSGPYLRDLKATRRKHTARASRGLHEQVEVVSDASLLDIADYIITVATLVEEFFFDVA